MAGDEAATSILQRSVRILDTIFHQAVAVVFVYILWVICCSDIDQQLKWHMALSLIAYVPLMAEAVVAFTDYNSWGFQMSRQEKCNAHASVMTFSAILTSAGVILVIMRTVGLHDHFIYEHGWTGAISWICVLFSQVSGLVMVKAQHSNHPIVRPVCLKFLHNFSGLFGYICGMVSLAYGLYRPEFAENSTKRANISIVGLMVLVTVWSVIPGLRSGFRQIKAILSTN